MDIDANSSAYSINQNKLSKQLTNIQKFDESQQNIRREIEIEETSIVKDNSQLPFEEEKDQRVTPKSSSDGFGSGLPSIQTD